MNDVEKFEIRISDYGSFSTVATINRLSDDKKHILFFNNCDTINGIIYFLIMSNINKKIQIDLDCDFDFWNDFVNLHNKHNKKNTKLFFTGKYVKIKNQKINDYNVFFTGGKDSVLTLFYVNKEKIIPNISIFESPVSNYSLDYLYNNKFIVKNVSFFTTNMDNELFYTVEDYESDMIIFLPILSKYANNFIGVNSEDLIYDYIFDFYDYELLFLKHGLKLKSPILAFRPSSVIFSCEKEELSFKKCTDNGYCYRCTECISIFLDSGYKFIKSFKPSQEVFKGINKVIKNPNKYFDVEEKNYPKIEKKYKKYFIKKVNSWLKENKDAM